ncbi:MAG: GNAT family N-acetyltransferase [Clostridia bacterium]|nr:GNAT family N-acetyltransferase [Clostridia bacterium]
MAQLKMYRLAGMPFKEYELPEGYSISKYKTEKDKLDWVECCKNGLVADDADEKAFDEAITNNQDINIFNDVFFLDYNGEHIGTVTAFVNEKNIGDMHMVGIRSDYRGRGLAKYLSLITIKEMEKRGVKYTLLTTDEWRKGAVKSYLSAGFLPVKYDRGMIPRWEAVLEEYGIDSVLMLRNNAKPFRLIYRSGLKTRKE